MKLTIDERVLSIARPHITWLEAGEYDVVRFTGPNKVMIDVTPPTSIQRQLTIVRLGGRIYLNGSKNKDSSEAEEAS